MARQGTATGVSLEEFGGTKMDEDRRPENKIAKKRGPRELTAEAIGQLIGASEARIGAVLDEEDKIFEALPEKVRGEVKAWSKDGTVAERLHERLSAAKKGGYYAALLWRFIPSREPELPHGRELPAGVERELSEGQRLVAARLLDEEPSVERSLTEHMAGQVASRLGMPVVRVMRVDCGEAARAFSGRKAWQAIMRMHREALAREHK